MGYDRRLNKREMLLQSQTITSDTFSLSVKQCDCSGAIKRTKNWAKKTQIFIILRNVILHSTLGSYSPRPLSLPSYLISHIMHMESGLTALAQRSVFGGGVWGNLY